MHTTFGNIFSSTKFHVHSEHQDVAKVEEQNLWYEKFFPNISLRIHFNYEYKKSGKSFSWCRLHQKRQRFSSEALKIAHFLCLLRKNRMLLLREGSRMQQVSDALCFFPIKSTNLQNIRFSRPSSRRWAECRTAYHVSSSVMPFHLFWLKVKFRYRVSPIIRLYQRKERYGAFLRHLDSRLT